LRLFVLFDLLVVDGDQLKSAVRQVEREFFGSALNANVHVPSIVLDGVFRSPAFGAGPVFDALPAPTDEIAQIQEQIHERVTRLLRRRGRDARRSVGQWHSHPETPVGPVAPNLSACANTGRSRSMASWRWPPE
jgi:hypothetical protein